MGIQLALRLDEDFIESCKAHHEEEMVRCYGCHYIVPKSETLGGYCGDCVDISDEGEVNS